jgi:predicted nucleotide-binding protein
MNHVPSRQRKPQQPTSTGQSVLRIPQAEAETQLDEQIATGEELVSSPPTWPTLTEVDALEHRAKQWTDSNCAWLDKTLGGEAAVEYRTASAHHYGYGASRDPVRKLISVRNAIESEISKLKSIRARLGMWAPEADIVPANHIGQVSPDAPIFIVHGRDTLRAESVAHTVGTVTGRRTIILRDQPNMGRTLMEKFEQHAVEASYAIIVLTADDKGSLADEIDTRPRGRQNVIFEMGYFYGLIGRERVSVLLQPGIEKPSDMDGIVYITYDDNGAWKTGLFRELQNAGIDIRLL